MIWTFTIDGAPRTKKTSNRVVRCGAFTKVLPSEAHALWFKQAMSQAPVIRNRLRSFGLELPVTRPVSVAALIYRERAAGDLCGYLQALGDFIQAPRNLPSGKKGRDGAGIIADDALVVSWDGSRLLKDAEFPRIEVSLRLVEVGKLIAEESVAI